MNLQTFIEQIGDDAAASLFCVKPRTVAAWRRGERTPRKEQAAVIVAKSQGRVTYADIYAPIRTASLTVKAAAEEPEEIA